MPLFKKTIKQLLTEAVRDIDILDAELLLAFAMHETREYLVTYPERNVPLSQRFLFRRLVKKRCNNYPTHYLLGASSFYGLPFIVNESVLIPRPSTETLVELATEEIVFNKTAGLEELLVVDLGTGAGAVPIALAHNLEETLKPFGMNPNDHPIYATDISKAALKVAGENIDVHKKNIVLLHGDLLDPITTKLATSHFKVPKHFILTANLPYIPEETVHSFETTIREPLVARSGGPGGLILYKKLLEQLRDLFKTLNPAIPKGGMHFSAFFEMDPDQMARMQKLVDEYLPGAETAVHKDMGKMDRIMSVRQLVPGTLQ